MSEKMDVIKSWGVDIENTLERFCDDEEFYIDCLKSFQDDTSFDQLKTDLENKDYHAAFETSHTLKGVIGNLGVTNLYNVVCALVEDLRANKYDDVDNKYAAIAEEKTKFFNELKEL